MLLWPEPCRVKSRTMLIWPKPGRVQSQNTLILQQYQGLQGSAPDRFGDIVQATLDAYTGDAG